MPLERAITILLILAAGTHVISWLCLLLRRKKTGLGVFGLGWGFNAALFAINWIACGHPPFGNMYHVLVFLSLAFPPLYLVIAVRYKLGWTHLYFALSSAVPLIGAFFMERDVFWRRVPALQSPWFVPHVFSYMVSYALATVAFVLLTAQLVRRRQAERYSAASYRTIRLGFPFMTFGLLSGALWAEEVWGIYWSWDAKETWSLITWTLYVVYFHCRSHAGLKRYAAPAQILAFIALLTTFLLVNLLPKLASVLHSYT